MEPVIIPRPLGDNPPKATLLYGQDVLATLRSMPDKSVHMVATSPPYWGLRDYKAEGQLGMEATPQEFVARLVEIFDEIGRVLRDDGTVWLNLGDTYAGGGRNSGNTLDNTSAKQQSQIHSMDCGKQDVPPGLKTKDLVGVPWRVALALQAAGWYLRSDIVWCLSGGTWLYVRTQRGDMPMTIKDIARLDPSTVQLWNGAKWTQLLGVGKSARRGDELEIVLRSGERFSCTPSHRFPTGRGLQEACNISVGDVLQSCRLPQPEIVKDCVIDDDAAWFAGLYIAEGSRSGDTIQFAGHSKETARWDRIQIIAAKFGGTATMTVEGNNQSIRVYGKVLSALLEELVNGRTSHDKSFAPVVWRYSNAFISAMVDGYLSGDGHHDGDRWRLGFCRNYNLERDLRTACARLGYSLTLNLASVKYAGKLVPTFRGELRKSRSGHFNEKDRNEVMAIRKARCRNVYDLGVADAPNLFALASGILTHNSKPNPMPESVTDRPTKSHEYVFLLTKKAQYFYDREAIRESFADDRLGRDGSKKGRERNKGTKPDRSGEINPSANGGRNKRSVWTISPKPYPGAHFAVWPPELVEVMVRAGTSEKGCCAACGAPYAREVVKRLPNRDTGASTGGDPDRKDGGTREQDPSGKGGNIMATKRVAGSNWTTGCSCEAGTVPCTVLDPFSGSATTGALALQLGRDYIGIDINPDYLPLAQARLQGLPAPSGDEPDTSVFDLFEE